MRRILGYVSTNWGINRMQKKLRFGSVSGINLCASFYCAISIRKLLFSKVKHRKHLALMGPLYSLTAWIFLLFANRANILFKQTISNRGEFVLVKGCTMVPLTWRCALCANSAPCLIPFCRTAAIPMMVSRYTLNPLELGIAPI